MVRGNRQGRSWLTMADSLSAFLRANDRRKMASLEPCREKECRIGSTHCEHSSPPGSGFALNARGR
jgi:hypothetical protein